MTILRTVYTQVRREIFFPPSPYLCPSIYKFVWFALHISRTTRLDANGRIADRTRMHNPTSFFSRQLYVCDIVVFVLISGLKYDDQGELCSLYVPITYVFTFTSLLLYDFCEIFNRNFVLVFGNRMDEI